MIQFKFREWELKMLVFKVCLEIALSRRVRSDYQKDKHLK